MNRMSRPSACSISRSTALRRSSNSPRYFAPATIAPMSSATTSLSFSDVGTSPATMRCARPSTMAVLPVPGSPMSTGLFFVRRDSTWMTRRISSSRPMTGSSLPSRARSVRLRLNRSSAWNCASGFWSVTRAPRRSSVSASSRRARGQPLPLEDPPGLAGVVRERDEQVLGGDVASLSFSACLPAAFRTRVEPARIRPARPAAAPVTVGSVAIGVVHLGRHDVRVAAHLRDDRAHDAVVLVEQRLEQVLRLDDLLARLGGAYAVACRTSCALTVSLSSLMGSAASFVVWLLTSRPTTTQLPFVSSMTTEPVLLGEAPIMPPAPEVIIAACGPSRAAGRRCTS